MAKNKNWRDAECALKKTHKPNHGMKEKKRHSNLQKLQKFNNKKAEKQQAKDMMARQAALEKMGMPAAGVWFRGPQSPLQLSRLT